MEFDHRGNPLAVAILSQQPAGFLALLLSAGADPNTDAAPLPCAVVCAAAQYPTTAALKLLLEHGAILKGSGALKSAMAKGKIDTVAFLLAHGAEWETDGSGS